MMIVKFIGIHRESIKRICKIGAKILIKISHLVEGFFSFHFNHLKDSSRRRLYLMLSSENSFNAHDEIM